ncbi:hypothetical protein TUBRATIS_009950 [Tubulinosema ratisbonensis]|uniref:Uncharacterized protein n=1 Tax=Tubulinosema ratisbonensis TaxID=291195 RepID=A0A437AN63_9MICR|nr:hypothetical protein TUBRATIS_009950 [Tubulinosema ratisbonensis]
MMYLGLEYNFITQENRKFSGRLIVLDCYGTLSFDGLIETFSIPKTCCVDKCFYCVNGKKYWNVGTFKLTDIKEISEINY